MTIGQKVRRACYQAAYPLLWLGVIVTRRRLYGVRTVVVRENEILLVQHTYSNHGTWLLPGGSVKRNEDLTQAAARETLEEVGLTVKPRPLGAMSFIRFGTDITNHGFWAEAPEDSKIILDPVELAVAGWFDLSDLPKLAPGIAEIIYMYRDLVKNA